jgi:hypothetical protein
MSAAAAVARVVAIAIHGRRVINIALIIGGRPPSVARMVVVMVVVMVMMMMMVIILRHLGTCLPLCGLSFIHRFQKN